MKKTQTFIALTIACSMVFSTQLMAHSGRTDSRGGHTEKATGTYHYHNSGYSTSQTPRPTATPRPTVTPRPTTTPTPTPEPELQPILEPTQEPTTLNPLPAENTTDTSTQTLEKIVDKEITVFLEGNRVEFDQPPIIKNERLLVPIRIVVEKIGCTVEWDEDLRVVYINEPAYQIDKIDTNSDTISLYVNNDLIVFDDQDPVIVSSRLLIPIRAVMESLGYTANWDEESMTLHLTKTNS